jgi:hypothetical protein
MLACLALFLLVPYALIYLLPLPRWQTRTMASACLVIGISIGGCWFGLAGRMIRPGGRLSLPRYADSLPRINASIRVLVTGFAALFTFTISFPFLSDLVALVSTGRPTVLTSEIDAVAGTFLALPFLKESVYIRQGMVTDTHSYTLLYSFERIRPGLQYELCVLSRSRIILDFRDLKDHSSRGDLEHICGGI